MKEISCHMFKVGFKSLRGSKNNQSVFFALSRHGERIMNHWSETAVGEWKESVFLSRKQRGGHHRHSCSLSSLDACGPCPGSAPGFWLSHTRWKGAHFSTWGESEVREGFPNSTDFSHYCSALSEWKVEALGWKFWSSRYKRDSRDVNINISPQVEGYRWTGRGATIWYRHLADE